VGGTGLLQGKFRGNSALVKLELSSSATYFFAHACDHVAQLILPHMPLYITARTTSFPPASYNQARAARKTGRRKKEKKTAWFKFLSSLQ
jgi:hypothetical protein